jgi:GNAT superfamily N-acetyltransferase
VDSINPGVDSAANIRLRNAEADDAADIAALLAQLGYPADARDIPSRLSALVDEGGAVILAVDSGGRTLGMMALARHSTLHSHAPVAYIMALVTALSARRRGVGRTLVEAAKSWARTNKCNRLTVTSAEHRSDAHAFYPSCGMPYTGRRFAAPIPELENP